MTTGQHVGRPMCREPTRARGATLSRTDNESHLVKITEEIRQEDAILVDYCLALQNMP